ncbi:oligosaccharide repeat unit polymerase [Leptospira sp. 201903071]|uniref:O-antigen polymerase n=1 Tax=Leptospira ainazelensis TaxID=2810034 RepID=UPI001965243C|nr:O-antigen polymerase [Leptospira ainazelensis]MBM9501981.1 oligosaccharide repeat unit polymerase [Leptospira ainazelensis]
MSLVIIISGILNVALSYYILKKTCWILVFIHSYWFFWMFISSLSLTGIFIPSNFTYYIFIMLLSSLTIGAGLYKVYFLYRKRKGIILDEESFSFFGITELQKEFYFFLFILIFVFPIVSFFLLKSAYMNLSPGSMQPSHFRAHAFGVYGDSILFGKNKYLYYYSLAINPLILATLFLGIGFYLRMRKKKVLIMGSALVAMDTLMMLGRFGFYYILIFLSLIVFIKFLKDRKSLLESFSAFRIVVLSLMFILIFFIGNLRSSGKEDGIKEFVNVFVIDYHTESFAMFDHELKNKESFLHERTYGRSSLGGLERGFSFLLGLFRVPFHFQVQSDLIGGYLHKNRLLGYTPDGRPKEYNAFGSVLFSLYKDGGIPFTLAIGVLFGFIVSKFSESLFVWNPFRLSILASLLFIGVFGLFQPVLGGPILLTILFIVVFSFL